MEGLTMNIPYLMKKIVLSITEGYKLFVKNKSPKLIMTLLVKNEEVMLERNLIFHKIMGVDGFIVTDNNSTDRTLDIISEYKRKGWILEVIQERDTDYEQKKWVDRMVWMAKRKYHADWVINADADEFWYPKTGNFKDELGRVKANALVCQVVNVYPEKGKDWWQWNKVVVGIKDYEKYNLSRYSIFSPPFQKVLHRTVGYIQISMGNHKVAMFPKLLAKGNIRIYHYNVQHKEQFLKKMINGGKQLEQHKGKHGGRHWRYFYNLYKEGKLEAEYERVIGTSCYDELVAKGFILTDASVASFFNEIGSQYIISKSAN